MQAIAMAALDTIMATHAEAVSTIILNGASASAIIDTSRAMGGLDSMGEHGKETGIARLKATALARPDDGATMIVDGDTVQVLATRLDPTGALLSIEYIVTKPNTEGS